MKRLAAVVAGALIGLAITAGLAFIASSDSILTF